MLINPNRFVTNVDDIYGIDRINMMGTLTLPGVATFYSLGVVPLPVTCPVYWASSYVKDISNPAQWNPDTSDEVYN